MKQAKAVAAVDTSQTTPVQIMHVLCFVVVHKLLVCKFDFCKSLTSYMMCI